jgi:hypothetical protein
MFCWSLFVLMYFFFWPLCCSSIYGFWLPPFGVFLWVNCVVLRYTDSDCPFGVFLWVNCKWFLYCQNKLNIYFKKNYPWDKIWTNLHINRATEEKQTSSVRKLYIIQFIQKQIWKNRIYERFMPFFFIYPSRNLETFILRLYSHTTKSYRC